MLAFRSLVFLSAAPFLFSSCESSRSAGDVTFARKTFESLTRGDAAAVENIDWETLNSLGLNVGASYSAIASETEREEFKNAFVTQFAASFRDAGGSADTFTNWRVTGHTDVHTEVSADSPNGVMRLTVSRRNDVKRVSKLEIIR
jgi:hypothetical protein